MRSMLLILLVLYALPALAQEEKKHIRQGNKLYEAKKFPEAEKSYREALEQKKDSFKAIFNLGDAYYQQGKYQEAAGQFEILATRTKSRDTLAKVYHNLGNSLLMLQEYDKSIAAYKKALRNNPYDEDTRYNLAYAQTMKKMQEQQKDKEKQDKEKNENKDDKDSKNDKEKNKESKDDQKNEGEKAKENEDKKDIENKKDEQQRSQQQISKEDAQRLLDALNNDEKNVQKKLKKGQGKANRTPPDKDW
jgi:Ca-activated chloride channel homolog